MGPSAHQIAPDSCLIVIPVLAAQEAGAVNVVVRGPRLDMAEVVDSWSSWWSNGCLGEVIEGTRLDIRV